MKHSTSCGPKRFFSQAVFTATIQDRMDPHEMLVGIELYGQINKLIERLPPKRQQVYRLIKDDDMCYKDVAKLMDISERTVEVHLKIAVRELRSSIVGYLEGCYSGTDNQNFNGTSNTVQLYATLGY